MSLRGDDSRGAWRTTAPRGARQGPWRPPGVLLFHGTGSATDQGGTIGTARDNLFRTWKKGPPERPLVETRRARHDSSVEQPGHRGAVGGRSGTPAQRPDAPRGHGLDGRQE